jgi:serine phosphatase RsbU (regulator of sigma subunit)
MKFGKHKLVGNLLSLSVVLIEVSSAFFNFSGADVYNFFVDEFYLFLAFLLFTAFFASRLVLIINTVVIIATAVSAYMINKDAFPEILSEDLNYGITVYVLAILIIFSFSFLYTHTISGSMKEISDIADDLEDKNKVLFRNAELLKKQKEEILAGIQYAQRIQSAILPPAVYVNEILPENFILFKPKDIVSGDFYWIKQVNDYLVIAAADCTGHGVPGAFMSMLGISFLNDIIHDRQITKANQVLNEMRNRVKYSLRQTHDEGTAFDGIDMSLCVINGKTKILQYAGAFNSVYIIRNGELIELKADRMPVGIFLNENPSFSEKHIQLKQNDKIYMFTDGFPDQLGGETGKKFLIGRFRELLLSVSNEPMQIQKLKLEQILQKWQDGFEQTDDILVMGYEV